jgi:Mg2+-importing ATPase
VGISHQIGAFDEGLQAAREHWVRTRSSRAEGRQSATTARHRARSVRHIFGHRPAGTHPAPLAPAGPGGPWRTVTVFCEPWAVRPLHPWPVLSPDGYSDDRSLDHPVFGLLRSAHSIDEAPQRLAMNQSELLAQGDTHRSPPTAVLDVAASAGLTADAVLTKLASSPDGLRAADVVRRRAEVGLNAIHSHRARFLPLLWRQVRSPLLALLAVAAAASFAVGERSDAIIIGLILGASVGLGVVNEFRAEKAAEGLHSQITHRCVVRRDGRSAPVDVVDLVPGDVVDLRLGEVVPADLRLLSTTGLEVDESVLTGESMPVEKSSAPVAAGSALGDLTCCALMGTVVQAGSGIGVVVATGGRAEFGRIALGLGAHPPETAFQVGLRRFSMLLVQVAAVLTIAIFAVNLLLHRPVMDSLLFSLAIAVGISPQLLPAVVATSLAAGSRQLARQKVLVKRLVCIEDLGDITVLFTDKTGTLTDGRISFMRALGPDGVVSPSPVLFGLLCTEATIEAGSAVDGNPLDLALWNSPGAGSDQVAAARYRRVATMPFDHERRRVSVLVDDPSGQRQLIVKGAPESVLDRCVEVSAAARTALDVEFAAGNRVIAVAIRPAPGATTIIPDDEQRLQLAGFLVFLDPPKPGARVALERLARLGVTVKIVTGDHPGVAARVCAEMGLPDARVVTGGDIDAADDKQLVEMIGVATVFARVSPEHKARIVRAQRSTGEDVAFLGDGVNDALALHAADVGISVESATDVAKDAADIILLEKDLDVLADGVVGGRRIFANTIKYVLMGTSSNFGNMFSAAGASVFLSFLPMLPSQILLNNLLYDTSQLAIPTDNVDPEQLARPSHWDVRFIRRFMMFFGPISSLFDVATFVVMLKVFHAQAPLFRSGWFVESLATQTLVIFAIRTRRVPFVRSSPSVALLLAALSAAGVGAVLPLLPFAGYLGFQPLPGGFFLALAGMVVCYLVLIEVAKGYFFGRLSPAEQAPTVPVIRRSPRARRIHRRAARFSTSRLTASPSASAS